MRDQIEMTTFTLKPLTGAMLYVIYAIVSYEENRGERGVLSFEEICSGEPPRLSWRPVGLSQATVVT